MFVLRGLSVGQLPHTTKVHTPHTIRTYTPDTLVETCTRKLFQTLPITKTDRRITDCNIVLENQERCTSTGSTTRRLRKCEKCYVKLACHFVCT